MNSWKYYALLAALCNASIGFFSKTTFDMGMSADQVAFYKCFIAFSIITLIITFSKNGVQNVMKLASVWWRIAICALFGIFTLYFFETAAYTYTMVPTVVFLLLGASSITTFLLSYFILKEKMTICHLLSFIFSICGLFFVLNENSMQLISAGGLLAIIAGCGYGLFLSLTKKLNLNTLGFAFLWWFIGFGTIFLCVPFMLNQPTIPSFASLPTLLILSLVPTIGGYYCTAKALAYGEASKVQLFELTEPVFASLIGFLLIGELLNGKQFFGAILILLSIYIASQNTQDFLGFLRGRKEKAIEN